VIESVIPAIPMQLAHRPVLAGLAVPWITAQTPDGRIRFGSNNAHLTERALREGLCQTCGYRLDPTVVFAMRDCDLRLFTSPEPGMHAVCARYSAAGCPMLSGRMSHHRNIPLTTDIPGVEVVNLGDPTATRTDAPAEPWNLMWASGYRTITHPLNGQPAAMVLPDQILRIRPIPKLR
jgi:hypothetical protein